MNDGAKPPFAGWAIVELMGHRVEAGYVTEEIHFGAPMVRIDSYAPGDEAPFRTRYYGGTSIYCLTPSTEDAAREAAKWQKPSPPTVLELPDGQRVFGRCSECGAPLYERGRAFCDHCEEERGIADADAREDDRPSLDDLDDFEAEKGPPE